MVALKKYFWYCRILPEKCYLTLGNAMGIFQTMDSFVGRNKSK